MKVKISLIMAAPILALASGCSILQNKSEQPQAVVVTEAEAVPQLEATFQEGDTLWDFAERTTGSGFNWERIKELNEIQDEKKIDAGIVLMIPPELALEGIENTL